MDAKPTSGSTPEARDKDRCPTFVFDIEVAGFPWEEVDEITRGYLVSRERDPSRRDAVQERSSPASGR
jgi:hypothetical protein